MLRSCFCLPSPPHFSVSLWHASLFPVFFSFFPRFVLFSVVPCFLLSFSLPVTTGRQRLTLHHHLKSSSSKRPFTSRPVPPAISLFGVASGFLPFLTGFSSMGQLAVRRTGARGGGETPAAFYLVWPTLNSQRHVIGSPVLDGVKGVSLRTRQP